MLGTEPPPLKDGSSSTSRMLKSSSARCILRFYLSWFWVFPFQVLNRDLWSNAGVKAIVGEHFVFWQQYKVICKIVKQNPDSEVENVGKWRGSQIYDLLPNHWVAACFHSWPKDWREHGHLEQVEKMKLHFPLHKILTTTNHLHHLLKFQSFLSARHTPPTSGWMQPPSPTWSQSSYPSTPPWKVPARRSHQEKRLWSFFFYDNDALYDR